MKIIIATQNPHKVEEIKEIAKLFNFDKAEFLPIDNSLNFDPVENGATFEENSYIKAKEANRLTGEYTLADDSGLCVNALDGAPGIHSARYAKTPEKRIEKLLEALKNSQDRSAKFVCSMTLINPKGETVFISRGECIGKIALTRSGANGFGYDPVFIVDGTKKTMAEMTEDEKNTISHRSLALQKVFDYLKNCPEGRY